MVNCKHGLRIWTERNESQSLRALCEPGSVPKYRRPRLSDTEILSLFAIYRARLPRLGRLVIAYLTALSEPFLHHVHLFHVYPLSLVTRLVARVNRFYWPEYFLLYKVVSTIILHSALSYTPQPCYTIYLVALVMQAFQVAWYFLTLAPSLLWSAILYHWI